MRKCRSSSSPTNPATEWAVNAAEDEAMELEPQRILVAITGTVEGQRALEHGIRMAELSGPALVGTPGT
jgi:hypothetical protein